MHAPPAAGALVHVLRLEGLPAAATPDTVRGMAQCLFSLVLSSRGIAPPLCLNEVAGFSFLSKSTADAAFELLRDQPVEVAGARVTFLSPVPHTIGGGAAASSATAAATHTPACVVVSGALAAAAPELCWVLKIDFVAAGTPAAAFRQAMLGHLPPAVLPHTAADWIVVTGRSAAGLPTVPVFVNFADEDAAQRVFHSLAASPMMYERQPMLAHAPLFKRRK
jgi:hypothetical protein